MNSCLRKILICLVFASGCNSQHPNVTRLIKTRNDRGELSELSYIIANKDTILDGKAVYYYVNGRIRKEVEYKNGLMEGWQFFYDSLGNMLSKTFYKKNLPNGYGFFYSQNGEINKRYFIDGIKTLDLRTDSKGLPIQYRVFDPQGAVQFVVLFDSTGKKVYENGYLFQDTIYFDHQNGDSIYLNKPVEFRVFTTHLPNYSVHVILDFFSKNRRKIPVKSSVATDGFYTSIKFVPEQEGKIIIALLGEMSDEHSKIIKNDTLFKEITVRPPER